MKARLHNWDQTRVCTEQMTSKMKKQTNRNTPACRRRKKCANHVADKVVISKIYKELYLNNNKTIILFSSGEKM